MATLTTWLPLQTTISLGPLQSESDEQSDGTATVVCVRAGAVVVRTGSVVALTGCSSRSQILFWSLSKQQSAPTLRYGGSQTISDWVPFLEPSRFSTHPLAKTIIIDKIRIGLIQSMEKYLLHSI